ENIKGNYTFVRGIGPFSAGVVGQPGFEIVHARFCPLIPLNAGYAGLERHLTDLPRPIEALCGMELRIPRPLSREAFDQFNAPYIARLKGWGLEVQGANPVTRTNVAYEAVPVAEPMLAGFYYTVASDGQGPTFVLSGVPEIASRDGGVQIVARGDISAEGLRLKTECIMEVLAGHLAEMRLGWSMATSVNLYTAHDLHPLLAATLMPALGSAAHAGITWYYSRPPVIGLEVEIDAHAVRRELVLMG
ncbi:MAG TPA: hypothetical protein VJN94_05935, partial [Candidatus Binataceae bacterium]|nr:hypothetical protein [Candidatus Binataceae bacterium]